MNANIIYGAILWILCMTIVIRNHRHREAPPPKYIAIPAVVLAPLAIAVNVTYWSCLIGTDNNRHIRRD